MFYVTYYHFYCYHVQFSHWLRYMKWIKPLLNWIELKMIWTTCGHKHCNHRKLHRYFSISFFYDISICRYCRYWHWKNIAISTFSDNVDFLSILKMYFEIISIKCLIITHSNLFLNSNYLKILSEIVNNTELAATLIRFPGTGALTFCFAGPVQYMYVHRGTCSTCMGNRKAEHSELLAAHEISRDFAAPWLYLCWTCVTVHKLYRPSEDKKITKWQRTSSQESDEHRHKFSVIYVRFFF